jgi:hypothetical protein
MPSVLAAFGNIWLFALAFGVVDMFFCRLAHARPGLLVLAGVSFVKAISVGIDCVVTQRRAVDGNTLHGLLLLTAGVSGLARALALAALIACSLGWPLLHRSRPAVSERTRTRTCAHHADKRPRRGCLPSLCSHWLLVRPTLQLSCSIKASCKCACACARAQSHTVALTAFHRVFLARAHDHGVSVDNTRHQRDALPPAELGAAHGAASHCRAC